MRIRVSLLAMFMAGMMLAAGIMDVGNWASNTGGNPVAPGDLSVVQSPAGPAVQVTVKEAARYQGVDLTLPEAVDLSKCSAISFMIKQSVFSVAAGSAPRHGCLQVFYGKRNDGLITSFLLTPAADGWSKITILLDVSKLESLKAKTPARLDKVTGLYFSLYEALKTPGQTMAIANVKFVSVEEADERELENPYMAIANWASSTGGHVGAPPKLEAIKSPYGQAIRATVQETNTYQGLDFTLPEAVDLNTVGAISFKVQQNVWARPSGDLGHICLQMFYGDRQKGLMTSYLLTKAADNWSQVTIPMDVRTLSSISSQSSPRLGKMTGGNISLYSALKDPGQSLAIADLRFIPKATGVQKLKVVNYSYATNRPTSGDTTGQVLNDGKVEEANQAFFEQYTSDPEIVFDLGALYLVSKVELSAVAVPSQNFFDYQIFTSSDKKEWRTAAHVTNQNMSGAKATYTVTGEKLSLLGRYIKLKPGRSRTDFHIYLAEAAFYGKIPTDAEMAAVAAQSYDLGPAISTKKEECWSFAVDGKELLINKKNGVVVSYTCQGQKLAERIFGLYELKDRKSSLKENDYSAKVISGTQEGNAFKVKFVVPKLGNLAFERTFAFVNGALSTTLRLESKRTDKKIFYTATQVVLPQALRTDGVYETWGAGHDMQHKFANEIAFAFPADTGPVVVFEAPKHNNTLLHFRYRCNDEYIQIGSGTVTVAGVGDKRTIFTANGWILGDGLFQLTTPGVKGMSESRLLFSQGDLTAAFDAYLAMPEVKAFRSRIKRAPWLKDIRLFTGTGWNGFWGNGAARISEYSGKLIREGQIIYGFCDIDFYWGDFPTAAPLYNEFGGLQTPEGIFKRHADVRKAANNKVKLFQYTWLWSVGDKSQVFKNHPDWFITQDADGRQVSFFPGWGINFYRQLADPAAHRAVVDDIVKFVNFYGCDVWYLDGGGSPSSIDWPKMRIDAPNAWDKVYAEIRSKLQETNPEAAVFFNHPENPLGDFGYLENNGGVMTSNWRDGATWMYKFKLWQRPDPLFSPLYIYWTPGVDTAFRQYIVGTGLGISGSGYDQRRDVPYISAQQQTRWIKLVNANLKPNWRYEPKELLEGMALTFGPDGWLLLKNHDNKPIRRTVAADLAPLGMTAADAPVYHWSYSLKPFEQVTEQLTEPDREAAYRASAWQTGFIIVPEFLGSTTYTNRTQREFIVDTNRMKLWYMTQSPALVWSVDGMRPQLMLSKTLGVEVKGRTAADGIVLTASSERSSAEIAVLLPDGKQVANVTINGSAVAYEPMVLGKARMVRVAIPRGNSDISVKLAAASPAAGSFTVAYSAAAPGAKALLTATGNAPVIAEIFHKEDLVWSKLLTMDGGNGQAEILMPTTVDGGAYQVVLYDLAGKQVAAANFKQAAGRPTLGFLEVLPAPPSSTSEASVAVDVSNRGIRILKQAERHEKTNCDIVFTPEQAALEVKMLPSYASSWNNTSAAYELEAKRYVQFKLSGNYAWMASEGPFSGIRNHTQKYGDAGTLAALAFDFEGKNGYAVRSFAGLGVVNMPIKANNPADWGTKKPPIHIFSVSAFVGGVEHKETETFWLDMQALGAPADWTGKAWMGLHMTNSNANRNLKVEILKSADVLPQGAKAVEPFVLQGGVKPPEPPKEVKIPTANAPIKVDGVLDEAAWKTAPAFSDFTLLSNPMIKAPATSVRMTINGNKLYLGVRFEENRSEGFNGNPEKSCWYNDGIEIYFQKRDGENAFLQYIFDVVGKSFAREYSNFKLEGAPEKDLAIPEFASKMADDGKSWTLEVAIPLAAFGKGADRTGFNFGRNRTYNGGAQTYSLAPGNAYRNFGVNLIRW